MIWLMQYPSYITLGLLFGISEAVTSTIISKLLPYLVAYFVRYIPHETNSTKHSELSRRIRFILDGTPHQRRKPQRHQHLMYNGHYKKHCMMSQLLVDYDGFIICVVTGLNGHMHDANVRFCKIIQDIIGEDFALADCAYAGVDFCVGGFKSNQITSLEHEVFDSISRTEQVIVENVNSFIKKARSISDENTFIHSKEKHAACVLICCGLYNMRRLCGEYVNI